MRELGALVYSGLGKTDLDDDSHVIPFAVSREWRYKVGTVLYSTAQHGTGRDGAGRLIEHASRKQYCSSDTAVPGICLATLTMYR